MSETESDKPGCSIVWVQLMLLALTFACAVVTHMRLSEANLNLAMTRELLDRARPAPPARSRFDGPLADTSAHGHRTQTDDAAPRRQ